MVSKYVIYTRVSTEEQGKSGLGLDAQMRDIGQFLIGHEHEVIGTYTDVCSGTVDDRPELAKALKLVKRTGAELVVSKLDRLSRDLAFIANLMKDREVRMRVAAMPQADKFQLHIYASLAEQEREMISQRTKAALKSAKARGVKLGGRREGALEKSAEVRKAAADALAKKAWTVIEPMLKQDMSLRQIASKLTELGTTTPQGKEWVAASVHRVIKRMEIDRDDPA